MSAERRRGLRVCVLTTGLGAQGAERQLFLAARALSLQGFTVSVVSMLEHDYFSWKLKEAGITVHTLEASRRRAQPSLLWRAAKALSRIKPDVLIGFNYPGTMVSRLLGLGLGIPIVISSLRSERVGGSLRQWALAATDRLSDLTTVNSRIVGEAFVSRGLVRRERVRVIPNGVDLEGYRALSSADKSAVRRALGVKEEEFLWVAAGRLEPPKDYPNLITAVGRVSSETPIRVVVAGKGPLLADLQELASQAGVASRLSFVGFRSDVLSCLAAADAVVLSSAWEGLPNVVLEALAVGTPVVTTDVGGVREVVEDGVSGFIVPPADSNALAEAMGRLMARPEHVRHAMGAHGQERVLEHFSPSAAGHLWCQVVSSCWQTSTTQTSSPMATVTTGAGRSGRT